MARTSASTLSSELTPAELTHLCSLLREKNFSGKHLEIGTAAGGTLCEMIKAAENASIFVTIDPMTYFLDQTATVKRNLTNHGISLDRVEIREMKSESGLQVSKAARDSFDFILIDGGHKLYHVAHDLRWLELVAVGGVIALHDYGVHLRGVTFAVDYFLRLNSNYKVLSRAGSLLIIEKSDADPNGRVKTFPDWLARLVQIYFQLENSWRKRFKRRA